MIRFVFFALVAVGCGFLFVWTSGFLLPYEEAGVKERIIITIKKHLEQVATKLCERLSHDLSLISSASDFDRVKEYHPYLLCFFIFHKGKQVFPPPPATGVPPSPTDPLETILAQRAETDKDNKTLKAILREAVWVETVLAAERLLGESKNVMRWGLLPSDVALPLVRLEKSQMWREKMDAAVKTATALSKLRHKIWPPLAKRIEKILTGVLQNAPLLEQARTLENILHELKLGERWQKFVSLARKAPEGFSHQGRFIVLSLRRGEKCYVGLLDRRGLLRRYLDNARAGLGEIVELNSGGEGYRFKIGAPVFTEVVADAANMLQMARARITPIKLAIGGSALGLIASLLGLWLLLHRKTRETVERSRFLSAIGHELKTPLTTIRLYAEMLASGRYRDIRELEHLARVVGGQAAALNRHIERLLLFSRMQRGAFHLAFQKCSLNDIIKDALSEFSPIAEIEGARIHLDEAKKTYTIHADPNALKEVLLNLLSNAVKFTHGKPKDVWVSTGDEKGLIFFEVKDKGEGIPEELQDKIFREYWRMEGEGRPPGAGLGLALVKRIVDAHKGEIEVRSRPGKGTVFRIILPVMSEKKEGG